MRVKCKQPTDRQECIKEPKAHEAWLPQEGPNTIHMEYFVRRLRERKANKGVPLQCEQP